VEFSPPPYFDLQEEFDMQSKLLVVIQNRLVESAHDVAEGGLFIALAESSFQKNLGFAVKTQNKNIRQDAYWFGESQSRVLLSVKNEKLQAFKKAMDGFPHEHLGEVTTSTIEVNGNNWGNIREWKHVYDTVIEKEMESIVEA
jgi:phosphoribosylformylglycinamidine synthase subunit PurL